jgi:hypothetical protein
MKNLSYHSKIKLLKLFFFRRCGPHIRLMAKHDRFRKLAGLEGAPSPTSPIELAECRKQVHGYR